MNARKTTLLKNLVDPLLKEHLEAYLLLGYSADSHERVVLLAGGADPACRDGLVLMHHAARHWQSGKNMTPPGAPGGARERS